jgi:hypothetical protein
MILEGGEDGIRRYDENSEFVAFRDISVALHLSHFISLTSPSCYTQVKKLI